MDFGRPDPAAWPAWGWCRLIQSSWTMDTSLVNYVVGQVANLSYNPFEMHPNGEAEAPRGFATSSPVQDALQRQNEPQIRARLARSPPATGYAAQSCETVAR